MSRSPEVPIAGPASAPIVGNLPDLDAHTPVQGLMALAREYGPIFRLAVAGRGRHAGEIREPAIGRSGATHTIHPGNAGGRPAGRERWCRRRHGVPFRGPAHRCSPAPPAAGRSGRSRADPSRTAVRARLQRCGGRGGRVRGRTAPEACAGTPTRRTARPSSPSPAPSSSTTPCFRASSTTSTGFSRRCKATAQRRSSASDPTHMCIGSSGRA